MAEMNVTIFIPADIADVWADLEQLETHSDWMADAGSIEFAGDIRRGVGTVMKVSTRIGPFRTTDVIRVVSWEPPHSMGVVHEGLVTGTGRFLLEPDGDGTAFTWREQLTFPWYLGGAVAAIAARPVLRLVWKRNLVRLAGRFG
jgi:carbon monoxide dehydrogenase subunit G